MALPTKSDFLLCEGVREEKGKKLTILGFYAGNDIKFPKGTKVEDISLSITFLVRFKDGLGKWKAFWKVVGPKGVEAIPKSQEIIIEKREDQYSIIILQIPEYKVKEYGTHKLITTLADKNYEFEYEINADNMPESLR